MRLGGRVAAAIEILDDTDRRHRLVSAALKDWGLAHRFAGSSDRAFIGDLVYDTLRQKLSCAWYMNDDSPKSLVVGTLLRQWDFNPESLLQQVSGDRFAPDIVEECSREKGNVASAPEHVRADVQKWCGERLADNFAEEWIGEARALAVRAPMDLRVNTLKSDRARLLRHMEKYHARPTRIARHGIRIPAGKGAARQPNIQADPGFRKGWFEVQDEGSQVVADLVFARPGENILDYCAGAGGKTLALAAAMENRGQIHAYDADPQRLAPIFERLSRAGTRNVQVHAADAEPVHLKQRMDRVVVDAPCTGSGTWRRRPDTKWRISPASLSSRISQQAEILRAAAAYVRPQGYLVYITCSLFPEENEMQIDSFLAEHASWSLLTAAEVWQDLFGFDQPKPWSRDMASVTLTPASTGTDGFYFAVLQSLA